jgi:putative tricarboxylic transport membrane protein
LVRPPTGDPASRTPSRWARADVAGGAALLVLAALAWVAARALPLGALSQPGAGFFPRILTLLLAALSLVLLVRGLTRPGVVFTEPWTDRPTRRRLLLMTGALVFYIAAVGTLGYLVTTAALFVVMVRWVGGRGWLVSLAVAALSAAGSWYVFGRLLRVNLPAGALLP